MMGWGQCCGRMWGLGGGDPLDVARRRLAAGDLTVGEFERIREELRDD